MKQSVKIIAILKSRPGMAEELYELLHTCRAQSRAEPGNLGWDIWQDRSDGECFTIDATYRDAAALAAHRATPAFAAYAERAGELAELMVITLDAVEVAPNGD